MLKFFLVAATASSCLIAWFSFGHLIKKQKIQTLTLKKKGYSPSATLKPQASLWPSMATDSINKQETHFRNTLYQLINAYRRDHHASPLRVNQLLESSSQLKLHDMINYHYWRHTDQKHRPPWQFFDQANYHYQLAGENLAFDQTSAWRTFQAWVKSAPHRKQLLQTTYEDMGLAIDCHSLKLYRDHPGCLVVLHLGKQ